MDLCRDKVVITRELTFPSCSAPVSSCISYLCCEPLLARSTVDLGSGTHKPIFSTENALFRQHFSQEHVTGSHHQRWASTHANRSNARRRLKTLPSIGRSNRSSFFKKSKISVAPSISMFKRFTVVFKSSIFTPLNFFSKDRTFYLDFRPSMIEFFDRKPSIFYICGIKMHRILSPFQIWCSFLDRSLLWKVL